MEMKAIRINGKVEYKVVISKLDNNNTSYTAYYSNGLQWSKHVRNTVAMEIIDNGNGLVFTQKKKNQLDYAEAQLLKRMLMIIKD